MYPDVESQEGEGRTEGTRARDLGKVRRRKEATRVSTRRDVKKDSMVTKGVS